jgi:hypothetical protein
MLLRLHEYARPGPAVLAVGLPLTPDSWSVAEAGTRRCRRANPPPTAGVRTPPPELVLLRTSGLLPFLGDEADAEAEGLRPGFFDNERVAGGDLQRFHDLAGARGLAQGELQ